MEELETFVKQNECDYSANLPDQKLLQEAGDKMGVIMGPELTAYLLKYGYLGYESEEFYGINSKQGLDSGMVKQTLYLHDNFSKTKPYILLYHPYEHVYYLVDESDKVYVYNTVHDVLEPTEDTTFSCMINVLKDTQREVAEE